MTAAMPDIHLILPELILGAGALALLMAGVFQKGNSSALVTRLAVLLLAGAFAAVLAEPTARTVIFDGQFVVDGFGIFMKSLVLIGTALTLVLSLGYLRQENLERFEYPVIAVLASLGMLLMVSANNLLSLYVGLELQSLSLYVLAAFRRDDGRSSEAGLKYFVLGALSSGMLLYGASLVYGFTGTLGFDGLAAVLRPEGGLHLGLLFGIVFIAAGLAFKVSAVPFHMWTPDVYEGAPTPVTAFFAAAPKVAAMALFVRVMVGPFGGIAQQWQQIVIFISIASMILGAVAAIGQSNIKRLLAYSSIGHVGFALMGLATHSSAGVSAVLIYMAIYLAMTVGAFTVVLQMRREGGQVEDIAELSGLARTQPGLAAAMAIFMFSLAGIPPLAGFFAKWYVFLAAIQSHMYTMAVIGVLSSVVGAYYYLRVIKVMYFDEPRPAFAAPVSSARGLILVATAGFTLLFLLAPGQLVGIADAAARTLLP